jgi:futalosine hydrolase
MMLGSKKIISGKIGNRDVVWCAGGMGKANAAHAATLLITRYDPEVLIIFGIGGAYPSSGAQVGDVAIAAEEIAGDEGVLTGDGFKDTEYIGIPLIKSENQIVYSRYIAPELTLAQSLKSLGSSLNSEKVHVGSFVTLSTCTGTSMRARELEERYHGLCENMEGAAAAHVATLHNVPWLEIRGISNLVEERDLKKWEIVKAVESVQDAVMRILEGWKR